MKFAKSLVVRSCKMFVREFSDDIRIDDLLKSAALEIFIQGGDQLSTTKSVYAEYVVRTALCELKSGQLVYGTQTEFWG